ncbi:MAG: class I SAM-dependent methyltransferase, partial [Candidatus Paceibacterales bacterium]
RTKHEKISVLNLFGYTGGATLACAKSGASVCHVDASKFAVDLAHANLDASGLPDSPVRFIVDDVRKFVEREIKRGNKYDVILLDPPVYGKGVKGESWRIEEDLLPLLSRLKNLVSPNPTCVLLNGYASIYSHVTYAQMLGVATVGLKGEISSGEIAIRESSGKRLLPCGIFARFEVKS